MFFLVIAQVDKNLFQGEVESVTCPGSDGEFTLLSHHEPFISTLKQGEVVVRGKNNAESQIFQVDRGLLEVGRNRATILI